MSPPRPRDQRGNRASLLQASSPTQGTPYRASLWFATTPHLRRPADTPSRKPEHPAARPAALGSPGELRAAPLPLRCWVPPSGPQVRTSTSDLARHPRAYSVALRARLRSAPALPAGSTGSPKLLEIVVDASSFRLMPTKNAGHSQPPSGDGVSQFEQPRDVCIHREPLLHECAGCAAETA